MGKYAVVNEKNEVVNVIEWDGVSNWKPPEGHTVKPDEYVSIGDLWDEKTNQFLRPLNRMYGTQQ